MSAVIGRVTTRADRERIGVSPDEIAATLVTLGRATEYEAKSRAEFLDHITVAVRLICAGWSAHPER